MLELRRTPTHGYRVHLSIGRIENNLDLAADDIEAIRTTENVVWNGVEVYPREPKGYLRIWTKRRFDEDAVDADDESIGIELKTLHVPARSAVEFHIRVDRNKSFRKGFGIESGRCLHLHSRPE